MLIRRKPHSVPGLNTTSTADISFMLLIFFLVTTSMDVDKGLARLLPPLDNKELQEETQVDRRQLMTLELTADNRLLKDGKPFKVEQLRAAVKNFVRQTGKGHLISIESSPEATYDLYFQVQNQLVAAYAEWRDGVARQRFGKSYAHLSASQKEQVQAQCPQRIAENYALSEGGRP